MNRGLVNPPPEEMTRRLSFIMHQAWLEARKSLHDEKRLFDLADLMEYTALLIRNYAQPHINIVRDGLRIYRQHYPDSLDYLEVFDHGAPEDSTWLTLDNSPAIRKAS